MSEKPESTIEPDWKAMWEEAYNFIVKERLLYGQDRLDNIRAKHTPKPPDLKELCREYFRFAQTRPLDSVCGIDHYESKTCHLCDLRGQILELCREGEP